MEGNFEYYIETVKGPIAAIYKAVGWKWARFDSRKVPNANDIKAMAIELYLDAKKKIKTTDQSEVFSRCGGIQVSCYLDGKWDISVRFSTKGQSGPLDEEGSFYKLVEHGKSLMDKPNHDPFGD